MQWIPPLKRFPSTSRANASFSCVRITHVRRYQSSIPISVSPSLSAGFSWLTERLVTWRCLPNKPEKVVMAPQAGSDTCRQQTKRCAHSVEALVWFRHSLSKQNNMFLQNHMKGGQSGLQQTNKQATNVLVETKRPIGVFLEISKRPLLRETKGSGSPFGRLLKPRRTFISLF